MASYETYIRGEWDAFMRDPNRAAAYRKALGDRRVQRVLDVGCGAGQELFVFVSEHNATGVGIDIAAEAGQVARDLFQTHAPQGQVQFLAASAEQLPFESGSFDVVISRLSLPYTHNARALAEFSRVLKKDGVLLLKIHHARFYLYRLWMGLKQFNVRNAGHSARVLLNGTAYRVTGRQPLNGWLRRETFQTRSMLQRECARVGLWVTDHRLDAKRTTPYFVIRKTG